MKAICARIAGKKDRESFILLSGAQRPARQEGAQTRESFFGAGFIQSAKVSDIFIDPESALTAPAPKLAKGFALDIPSNPIVFLWVMP
jgi:hypothetical protein